MKKYLVLLVLLFPFISYGYPFGNFGGVLSEEEDIAAVKITFIVFNSFCLLVYTIRTLIWFFNRRDTFLSYVIYPLSDDEPGSIVPFITTTSCLIFNLAVLVLLIIKFTLNTL